MSSSGSRSAPSERTISALAPAAQSRTVGSISRERRRPKKPRGVMRRVPILPASLSRSLTARRVQRRKTQRLRLATQQLRLATHKPMTPKQAATKPSRTVLRSRQRHRRGRQPPTRLSRHHPQPQLKPPQVQLRQVLNRPLKPPPHSPNHQREPQRPFLRRLTMTGTRNSSLGCRSITVLLRCPMTAMTGGQVGLTPMGTA